MKSISVVLTFVFLSYKISWSAIRPVNSHGGGEFSSTDAGNINYYNDLRLRHRFSHGLHL